VVQVHSRDELFREVCRIGAEHSGFKVVWVGWYNRKTRRVLPVAARATASPTWTKLSSTQTTAPKAGARSDRPFARISPASSTTFSAIRVPAVARRRSGLRPPSRGGRSHPFRRRSLRRFHRLRRRTGHLPRKEIALLQQIAAPSPTRSTTCSKRRTPPPRSRPRSGLAVAEPAQRHDDLHELMREVSCCCGTGSASRRWAFASAVEGLPYFETRGFPAEFAAPKTRCASERRPERSPTTRPATSSGVHVRQRALRAIRPEQALLQRARNFWTNSTTELLATTTAPTAWPARGTGCNREGYESVALVAIRSGAPSTGCSS